MVLGMIRKLPRISYAAGHATVSHAAASHATVYNVYMDNYFSTVGLFKRLRDIQCGAYGTSRRQGGIPSQLVGLKDHIKSIPWGRYIHLKRKGSSI
jgi:hypothetical protein